MSRPASIHSSCKATPISSGVHIPSRCCSRRARTGNTATRATLRSPTSSARSAASRGPTRGSPAACRGRAGTGGKMAMERGEAPLLKLARSLIAADGPGEFLRRLATAVREEIDADWAAVWILDRRTGRHRLEVAQPPELFRVDPGGAGAPGDLLAETAARRKTVVRRGEEIEPGLLAHLGGGAPPAPGAACRPGCRGGPPRRSARPAGPGATPGCRSRRPGRRPGRCPRPAIR